MKTGWVCENCETIVFDRILTSCTKCKSILEEWVNRKQIEEKFMEEDNEL